ncbi:hypothetical protein [Cytobacillus firmus]|uniref:hypothetical protein n=1 Tax=Cytobacillus firmus TaxID=1399 RepID=UPI001CFD4916|nr:hypothetical protein [Cytobacillus firmus]
MKKTIHDVSVPNGVTEKMAEVAKYYVLNRMKDGFTVQSMCSYLKISTATWTKWKENQLYMSYITQMTNVLVPDDELEAVRKFRRKVMAIADKDNINSNEFKLFHEMFKPIIEAEINMKAEELGLNKSSHGGSALQLSIEEKKASLLSRLKG